MPISRATHPGLTLVLLCLLAGGAAGQQAKAKDPLASLDAAIASAELALRTGELQIAESWYRAALFDGWMAAGALHVAGGRLPDAREAFREASRSVVDVDPALRSLALVELQLGNADDAVLLLTKLAARSPDADTRTLLAQALVANGRPEEAVQTLEEAHAAAPDNPEVAFLLASGYLRVKNIDGAAKFFSAVTAARPIPQTWVLIGRTYRDFRLFEEARAALTTALKKDPRIRRAHYYLGTIAVMEEGVVRLDEAIREFREELKLAPDDLPTALRLGMALVEARRESEAFPLLETVVRKAESAVGLLYLGRSHLALNRAAEAVTIFRRALELAEAEGTDEGRVRRIHYQLALALRTLGSESEAAPHFELAREGSERRAEADREQLTLYLAGSSDASRDEAAPIPIESPFASVPEAARADLQRRVNTALARAYMNLGIMRVQLEQYARAADLLEKGAAVDPEFPNLQYSLGVARFNAKQYREAAGALARALAADPGNARTRRMLGLAHLNASQYAQAADLLAGDSALESDPSLQYAYGLALARSDRAEEAEAVFNRLLTQHGDRAELHVILGQAHARQGDFDAAIKSLERARQLNPDVPDAGATLGTIYLKQGKLADAASALRDELRANPGNLTARHTLATVLDLEGNQHEAIALLRAILGEKPDFGDARYLLGKILLAQGDAADALPHLEAAVRLSPDDPTYHYQLSRAYQSLGRAELAQQHLNIFRDLKAKERGGGQ